VTEPLLQFKDLLGSDKNSYLVKHEQHQYHREAVERGKNFLLTYQNPATDVRNILNQQRLDKIK